MSQTIVYEFKSQQDRQCTYNVTLRRVRQTIVAVEKQKQVLHISLYYFVRASVCVCWRRSVGVRTLANACARVASLIQQGTRRHIAICSPSGSTIYFHIIL
jgi:hypothetical protein